MKTRSVILSFMEQAFASLGTLALTIAVVATSGPAVFGQFTFVFTLILIAASLQYGLVGTPLLVEISALEGPERTDALRTLFDFDFHYRLAASIVVAIVSLAVLQNISIAVLAGAFALVYLWRESVRNALFATNRPARAAALGAVALATLLPVLAAALAFLPGTPAAPLIAGAIANAIPLALMGAEFVYRPASPPDAYHSYRRRFPQTGWSLMNSAANESQTRAHVIVLQLARGADQLGLVEAGRVLFAPLFLISTAWRRAMQPHLAATIAAGHLPTARRYTLVGLATVATIAGLYYLVLYLAFPMVSAKLFGDRFPDVTNYVIGWAIYTVLLMSNWTMASYLNAMRAYRRIANITIWAAAATLVLLLLLTTKIPLIATLAILIFVQAIVFLTLFALLWRAKPDPSEMTAGRP